MSEHRNPIERLLDLTVYAPLGFALEARNLLPDMADRGRRQLEFTREAGRYALDHAGKRLERIVGTVTGSSEERPTAPAGRPAAEWSPSGPGAADGQAAEEPEPGPDPSHLPIPDYDSLSAPQVVPRLESLGPSELDEVREYEAATRGRRTILNKIAQLQHT